MRGRRRKGSAGRAASLVSPGPLARPCPAGRHARVGGSFRNNPVPKDEPNAKLPQQSRAKTRLCCMEAATRALAPARDQLRDTDADGLPEIAHTIERFDRN